MEKTVLPHQLADALTLASSDVDILSLDCFDTLIWRNTHAPSDVFADLAPIGASIFQRRSAEERARKSASLRNGTQEVKIADIYRELLPRADGATIERSIAVELAAEAHHCFAFRPTVDLIRQAKRQGKRVIIVSDTYLGRSQLSDLIGAAGGDEVLAQIDHIFCSSDYGVSKAEGLFKHVLLKMKVPAKKILHVGDNKAADFVAPTALGLQALHLAQFDEATEQRLRLEAATATLLDPATRDKLPTLQPHRAPIAIARPASTDSAARIGYATLGPVMHGFARWLAQEANELARLRSGRVHLLFLMRDAHLPKCVFETLADADDISMAAIEVSRFTATASSFADDEQIARYLESEIDHGRLDVIMRQLLFTQGEADRLIHALPKGKARLPSFLRELRKSKQVARIVTRSNAFAGRLVRHITSQVNVAAGDTLVLVDLGYNGSVQNSIEPLLRRELGVEVSGRYLLLREQAVTTCEKRGFLDSRHYDFKALHALCGNVAVLEQLCTVAQGSVVDYDDAGRPLRTDNGIKAQQSMVRDRAQRACIDFARDCGSAFVRRPCSDNLDAQRHAAAAALARLMFLPLPDEIEALQAFEHDVNLGVQDKLKLFDAAIAHEGLRRQGVFYLNGSERMYLPAELRGQGLPLSLTLMTQHRFGLTLKYEDFCDRSVDLPILIADGHSVLQSEVRANATHDGFFMAAIPVGAGRLSIGVQFGQLYDWVQIEAPKFMPVDEFLSEKVRGGQQLLDAMPVFDGIEDVSSGLLRCHHESAFMMVPPLPRSDDKSMILLVVFRPIAARATKQASVVPIMTEALG